MSAILALITITILIIIGMLRDRQPSNAREPVLVRRYYHPGHTWLRVTEDGDVLVGMDDFSQSIIGTIDDVELPHLLRRVKQGSVAAHVRHNRRSVPLVSPVTGRVIERNEMVLNDPSIVNTSPYATGWLFRVRPSKLGLQLHNLLTGKYAHEWQDMARAHLGRLFSGTPALMFQDGGVLLDGLSDRCSDEEWDRVIREIFLIDDATTATYNTEY